MKNLIFSALFALVCVCGVNAQTVYSNNYESPITGNTEIDDKGDSDSFSVIGLNYYGFKDYASYGISGVAINPSGLGLEFGVRAHFNDYGYVGWDLGPNYSFPLYSSDNVNLYLTLAVGGSLRVQQGFNAGNGKDETKLFVDGWGTGRLSAKFNRFVVSVGYFYWAPQFKFGDESLDGIHVSLGYCFR